MGVNTANLSLSFYLSLVPYVSLCIGYLFVCLCFAVCVVYLSEPLASREPPPGPAEAGDLVCAAGDSTQPEEVAMFTVARPQQYLVTDSVTCRPSTLPFSCHLIRAPSLY